MSPLFEIVDDVIVAGRLWHGRPFGVVPAGLTLGIVLVFVAAGLPTWPSSQPPSLDTLPPRP